MFISHLMYWHAHLCLLSEHPWPILASQHTTCTLTAGLEYGTGILLLFLVFSQVIDYLCARIVLYHSMWGDSEHPISIGKY
jgi:hypothetical protein